MPVESTARRGCLDGVLVTTSGLDVDERVRGANVKEERETRGPDLLAPFCPSAGLLIPAINLLERAEGKARSHGRQYFAAPDPRVHLPPVARMGLAKDKGGRQSAYSGLAPGLGQCVL
jgi:hypothetical protein